RSAWQDATAALISRQSRRAPTVLLFEDWHWADDASVAALRHLARYVPSHPILLVVSHRPGMTDWGTLRPLTLTLQPLDAAETEVVAASRFGVHELPDARVAFLPEPR